LLGGVFSFRSGGRLGAAIVVRRSLPNERKRTKKWEQGGGVGWKSITPKREKKKKKKPNGDGGGRFVGLPFKPKEKIKKGRRRP